MSHISTNPASDSEAATPVRHSNSHVMDLHTVWDALEWDMPVGLDPVLSGAEWEKLSGLSGLTSEYDWAMLDMFVFLYRKYRAIELTCPAPQEVKDAAALFGDASSTILETLEIFSHPASVAAMSDLMVGSTSPDREQAIRNKIDNVKVALEALASDVRGLRALQPDHGAKPPNRTMGLILPALDSYLRQVTDRGIVRRDKFVRKLDGTNGAINIFLFVKEFLRAADEVYREAADCQLKDAAAYAIKSNLETDMRRRCFVDLALRIPSDLDVEDFDDYREIIRRKMSPDSGE